MGQSLWTQQWYAASLTIGGTDGPSFAQSFSYDALNRLTSASEGGAWSQAYNYDQYGNMWMPTSSGLPAPSLGPVAPTTNAYSPSGPGNNRNVNSTYDNAGDLTVFGAMDVSYDAENRQTAAGSNSYSYDGFGLRVGKTTANGNTVYVYDAFGQLAAEYGSATTTSGETQTCPEAFNLGNNSAVSATSTAQSP